MTYKNILLEKEENIAILTLNRPTKLNALNDITLQEIRAAFREINEDPEIRVVIITGAGDRAFAAGADIEGFLGVGAVEGREHIKLFQDTVNVIEESPKIVIAAVNGFALGGGLEVTLGCDVIIASENAKFGLPEIKLGIIPGGGGTQRLGRLVGKSKAKELILTGNFIDAKEAHRINLVNKVVPQEELMKEAYEFAESVISMGAVATSQAKFAVNMGSETDLKTGLAIELEAATILFGTEDKEEGTKAFLEKRTANFKGR